jgi:DNA (cytosine-5)-methyltransferase 1
MVEKYNIIDLFSGAGGISCGFEMAGFKTLLGVDHDQDAIKTFLANHPYAQAYTGDIKKLDKKTLKQLVGNERIHVIVGGPPCQGFSTVGKGNPKDQRNHLFLEFCRIVDTFKPDFVVMENVTGLVAKKNEKTLLSIFETFKKMGYHLNVRVLSSEKYGVPEKRKRTVILATNLKLELEFPDSSHDCVVNKEFVPAKTVGEAFNLLKKHKNLKNHDLATSQIKNKLDLLRLKSIPEGKSIRYPEDEINYFKNQLKNLSLNINWEKLPENRLRQAKFQRLSRKTPSPTILTHRHTYFHPTEDRYLTVREAATLQSFPLDFEFHGTISSQWRQVGNAVPPLLAKTIALKIKNFYAQIKKSPKKTKVKKKVEIKDLRKSAFRYH